MSPYEIELEIRVWREGTSKVFRYARPLLPTEYITISRSSDTEFRCIPADSTYNLGTISVDSLKRLMSSGELTFFSSSWFVDVKKLKTGGCTCGAWATTDKNDHSPICDIKTNVELPKGWNYDGRD